MKSYRVTDYTPVGGIATEAEALDLTKADSDLAQTSPLKSALKWVAIGALALGFLYLILMVSRR
jgi:hypothetical protein